MLWWLFNKWEDRDNWEKIVVFANTGKEAEGTLAFVQEVSERWGIPIIWVESRHVNDEGNTYSPKGRKVGFRVVDYTTASRNGEPFEEMIKTLGIPSTNAPYCSEQLKKKAIIAYLKSIGWREYHTAIGIRYDEPDRISESAEKNRIMYPLYEHTVMSKWDILAWWAEQPFDLKINDGDGNCDNCWKKNLKLLVRNARNRPSSFDWWQEMTNKYGHLNPRQTKLKPPFNFYRGNLSPSDILALRSAPDERINRIATNQKKYSCSESCELF